MSFSGDPYAVIPWVVQATLNILEVAAQTTTIKSVVLASSSSTTYSMLPDPNGRQLDESEQEAIFQSSGKPGC